MQDRTGSGARAKRPEVGRDSATRSNRLAIITFAVVEAILIGTIVMSVILR